MRLTLLAIVVALAAVPSASASSKLAQRVGTAATRSGFSGEVAVARHGRIVFAHGYGLANRVRGEGSAGKRRRGVASGRRRRRAGR